MRYSNKKPDAGILFFDIVMAIAALMTALFILMTKLPTNSSNLNSDIIGSVCSEIYWDNDRNIDLDIWSKTPLDNSPVSYNHMHDAGSDLFKDVIGFSNNPEHINMEINCSKALIEGEYIYDVHYYSNHEVPIDNQNIKVNMIVTIKYPDKTVYKISSDYNFTFIGEEKTIISFKIGKDKKFISGSTNSIDRHLPTMK